MTKGSIAEKFAATKPLQQKLHSIEIRHPAMAHVCDELEVARYTSSMTDSDSPNCVLVMGPSGVGKTTICKRYLKQNPPDDSVFPKRIPVLFASIPKSPGPTSIPLALLRALGDRFVADRARNNTRLLYQTIDLIVDAGVELIILDEFQHLIDRERDVVLKDQADIVKTLVNEIEVPFAVFGLKESIAITDLNEQARRRFSNRISLDPFDWRIPHQQADFRKFLSLVEKSLPFPESSGLDHDDIAFMMYQASSGLIGYMMDIVRVAGTRAILDGAPRITTTYLSEAYERKVRGLNENLPNPFNDDAFDFDGIVEPGFLNQVLSTSEIKRTKTLKKAA